MNTLARDLSLHAVAPDRARSVTVDGQLLHVSEWNPDGERPVLLLHGAQVQSRTWDPVARALAEDRRVIAFDLRGHGNSAWAPRTGYRLGAFVADAVGVAVEVGVDRCDVVGHSLGARLALALAADHPSLVRRLVLSDSGPELSAAAARENKRILLANAGLRGFGSLEDAVAHYREVHPEWRPIFHELHARHQLRRNWAGKYVPKADPDLFWLAGSAGRRENPRLWDAAGRVRAPALLLWAKRWSFLDEHIVGRLQAAIPHLEVARPDTGHFIPREDPDAFIAHVRAFLDRAA
jgi:pimeloyl-ACP methyl ester carboxylesterase